MLKSYEGAIDYTLDCLGKKDESLLYKKYRSDFLKPKLIHFESVCFSYNDDGKQTIKDINNAIQSIQDNGIILIHDCLPKKIWNQIVPRIYGHWNGDVWKAIVEARTYNNIETFTCIADHGLGVILKRKNSKILNIKNKDFKNLKFSDYYKNHKEFMNPVAYEQLKKIIQD